MAHRYTLSGSTLRPRSTEFKTLLAQEIARNALRLIELDQLRPVMDPALPLTEAAHAGQPVGHRAGGYRL